MVWVILFLRNKAIMVYLYMWLEIYRIYMYRIYIARYVHTHKCTKFYTPQTSEHKFHFLKMYSSFKQYILASVSPPSAPPSSPCNLPSPRSTPQFPFRKEQASSLCSFEPPPPLPQIHTECSLLGPLWRTDLHDLFNGISILQDLCFTEFEQTQSSQS